jgi:catechol 2,3-dioxygenase-like lactoylglutathione lyase family enzyme
MSESAVQFINQRRVHISLAVSNVDRSAKFYKELFDVAPTKTRVGYARFEVVEPPLNLSIIQTDWAQGPADPISHFGIQVKSTSVVTEMRRRLESAELTTKVEDSVNCCHTVQDKIWIVDPDGYRWETFVVLDDAPAPETEQMTNDQCCPTTFNETCCPVGDESCCSEND